MIEIFEIIANNYNLHTNRWNAERCGGLCIDWWDWKI